MRAHISMSPKPLRSGQGRNHGEYHRVTGPFNLGSCYRRTRLRRWEFVSRKRGIKIVSKVDIPEIEVVMMDLSRALYRSLG